MPYTYILYSEMINNYYIGSCLDLNLRLEQHLLKYHKFAFTKRANDWKIVWKIYLNNAHDARKIETKIKRMKSKKYIQNLLKYPELTIKLITN